MNICDDVSKLIDGLEPGLIKEKDTALANPNLPDDNRHTMEQHWNENLMKLNIIKEVIARIREM